VTNSVDSAVRRLPQLKKLGPTDLAAAFLRLAMGVGLVSAVADRLGFWGPPGASMVSWGSFHNFLIYTAKLNPWCPSACLPVLGVVVSVAEAGLGILLIVGISSRLAALLTGMMTFIFAAAMTLVLGVHAPLIYSVFPFSAASFLLASQPPDKLSIDNLRELKKSRKALKED